MPTDLQPAANTPDLPPILTELATLTRDHLLHYRLEVGRVILDHFFSGSTTAYSDRDHNKETKFSDFLNTYAADLEILGLREHTLRQCVGLRTVYMSLPPSAQADLGYTRTLALVRMPDPTTRAKLALTAIAQGWSVAELKQTVDAAKAGLWYDTDPETPGVQAKPLAPETAKPPAPGRLVVQAEKWQAQFTDFATNWSAVAADKPTKLQRTRLKKALGEAIAQLQALANAVQD